VSGGQFTRNVVRLHDASAVTRCATCVARFTHTWTSSTALVRVTASHRDVVSPVAQLTAAV
jgi:hypothetical protein